EVVDVADRRVRFRVHTPVGFPAEPHLATSYEFTPDGKAIAIYFPGAYAGRVLHDAVTGTIRCKLADDGDYLRFSADGRRAVARDVGGTRGIRVFDCEDGSMIAQFPPDDENNGFDVSSESSTVAHIHTSTPMSGAGMRQAMARFAAIPARTRAGELALN